MGEFFSYWKYKSLDFRQLWQFDKERATKDFNLKTDKDFHGFLEQMMQDFAFDKSKNANSADLPYRMQKIRGKEIPNIEPHDGLPERLGKAIAYLGLLLDDDGHLPGDYGGPMFLLPGLIIVSYITETPFSEEEKCLMKAYMLNHQNKDGGWGLHIEANSAMMGSGLQYVALRLLGVEASHTQMQKARKWIQENGSVLGIPSWGKFYLAALGLYEWKGCNSLFPEIWLFPKWLPFHPWRYWCHARLVYLPMAYVYGKKTKAQNADLLQQLRSELYNEAYEKINWSKARDFCCEKDRYHHSGILMKLMNAFTNTYEQIAPQFIRKKACDYIARYLEAEDEQTHYIDIGPVNQALNSLVTFIHHGKKSAAFQKHVERWKDYLWVAEDGMKMQGYNGAHLWETAFFVNAICDSGLQNNFADLLKPMYNFIEQNQIRGVPREEEFFRHKTIGGWPFSMKYHGYPITDCTADGVKASIKLHRFFDANNYKPPVSISKERLIEAIDLILSFQSEDGGWASYEIRRGPQWLEYLNPSEIFGDIMVDYSYVECSSASIQALLLFDETYGDYRHEEIKNAVKKGVDFIKSKQFDEGSWYGSWGVCFTYAHWFAHEALALNGEFFNNSETVKKACNFLVSKQKEDGGWGESYESCVKIEYVQHEESQIINTAWALLALIASKYPDEDVLERAANFLISKQETTGDFPQEGISGVFSKNCMETYTSYRNVFPIWALGKYCNR